MKLLKSSSFLLCLALTTFFLTSCSKDSAELDTIIDEASYDEVNPEDLTILRLPSEISALPVEQVAEYLSELTEAEFKCLQVDDKTIDEVESRGCTTTYPDHKYCSGYSNCYPVLKKYRIWKTVYCGNNVTHHIQAYGCCNYG